MNPEIMEKVKAILEKVAEHGAAQSPRFWYYFAFEKGPKYLRVFIFDSLHESEAKENMRRIAESGGKRMSGGRIFMFVDHSTGEVFKPASWRIPAKGARFNLNDPVSFAEAVKKADPYGSFLYIR